MFDKYTHKANNKDQTVSGYEILNNKFSLRVPATWEDKSVYTFEGPEEDGVRHNIWVTIENNVEVPDLEQYAQMNIQAAETALQGYRELKRGPLALNNRQPAYELVYRWSPVADREVYQRVIYVLYNRTGYILTATFSKKTWKMLGTEIDKIFKSFTTG
jgi:hypothetical protein